MTKTPISANSLNSNHANSYNVYSQLEDQSNLDSSNSMNDSIAIAIQSQVVEPNVQPSYSNSQFKSLGVKDKTIAISKELSILRSSIEQRVSQLQTLIEKEGTSAELAELISHITARMRESLEAEDLFKIVVEETCLALQTDRVVVCRFEEEGESKIVAESTDLHLPTMLGTGIDDPNFVDRYTEFYQKGGVQAISNLPQSPLSQSYLAQLEQYQVKAVLIAPILVEDTLMGLLMAHQCQSTRIWLESEIELFRQIAQQVGYAVDQAQLLAERRATAAQVERLNQIYAQIQISFEIEDIHNTTVEETRLALNTDRVMIYEFDDNWKGTVVAESVGSHWTISLGAQMEDPCIAQRYVQPYTRGRVKAFNDVYNNNLSECHLQQLEPYEVKAYIAAPILVRKKLKALLIAHECRAPRKWSKLEIDLVRNIAVQAGYVLDKAYLIAEQKTATQQARFFSGITTQLRNLNTVEQVFDVVVDELRVLLGNDRVVMYKFDQNSIGTVVAESLATARSSLMGSAMGDKDCNLCRFNNYAKAYQRGQITVIDDAEKSGLDECHIELFKTYQIKAEISAPIFAFGKLHGLLMIHECSRSRKWSDAEVNLIQQLCTQISLTIDQLILLKKQATAAEQARRINQITSNIRESLNQDDIFQATVEELKDLLDSDRAVVYQFDENWKGTIVAEAVSTGFPAALRSQIYDPCFAKNYIRPYLKGRVKPTNDIYKAGLTECYLKQLEPYKVRANLVAPIIATGKLHGLLIAHQCSGPRQWTETDTDLIRQVSTQVGYALDQSLLLQQQRQAAEQARLLSEISSHIRQSLNPEKIVETTVKESLSLMQTDRVVIYRFDQDTTAQMIAEAVKPDCIEVMELSQEAPNFPSEYVEPFYKGRIQLFCDITKAELSPTLRGKLETWQVKAKLVVPIFINQQLYGLLSAHHCLATHTWSDPEIETFKQVALQMGYALEQALLLEQVQQARSIAEESSIQQQQQKQQLESQIESFLGDIEDSFDGNLTVRATVTEGVMGTVADFFNATIESLQQLVLQVQSAANVVTTTAEGSEQDIQELSDESQRQAEAITNALTQIQVMTSSIQAVAENAKAAEVQVYQAGQILETGDQAMNQAVAGIVAVQKTVYATACKVKNLGEASAKISRVVNLISEFANQTNILALNASVEATRVSQEEQGFGTVATEVRTLAEQSANATREIEQIVAEIQTETDEVIKAMELGLKRVMVGTKYVKGTRNILTDLINVSQHIQQLVQQIADSAGTQAQTSSSLSQTVQEVAEIAQQTSEKSLVVANSFNQLLTVAGQLQQGVTQFTVE
ncbi:MAG: GAF domain-containing protein [Microcoleaceae cyanobacterium]